MGVPLQEVLFPQPETLGENQQRLEIVWKTAGSLMRALGFFCLHPLPRLADG
jgi:hypothetical protein